MSTHHHLVFDVGLHEGEDTDFYLRKGFDVVAFEADPSLAAYCRSRFQREIEQGRLTIVEGAIAPAASGDAVTFFRSSLSVWGTTDPAWVERNRKAGGHSEAVSLPRVDMDAVFARFGVPHFLKIDIESADTMVLEALLRQQDRPAYISIESAMGRFEDLLREFDLLEQLGYHSFHLLQQETVPGEQLSTTDRRGSPLTHTFPCHASGPFGTDLPGPWLNRREALQAYRSIFTSYRLFGRDAVLRCLLGDRALRVASRLLRRPLPGWYDTHARLGTM